ncbi:class I SAM-dependent methyltransferase [Gulosibacter chungangensis]|uniref:Methyltransferase n=1 Tax=Gulosibacter chungangensis TaxID=979746 RepID=A0A7J5B9S7_9MICO|nr:methyltransferase [Gulosibacter chungangensis]KAB1642292.1 methyltransferase [Gulosibacter chungangensis]
MSEASSPAAGHTPLHDDPVIDVVLTEALANGPLPEIVAVIDDADVSFAQPLLDHGAREVRVFSDFGVAGALPAGVRQGSPVGGLFEGVSLVVGRLPKSLAELEDLAECAAYQVAADAQLILGARDKHLTQSMNESLGKYFAQVRGTRGMRKSRALVASAPIVGVDASGGRGPAGAAAASESNSAASRTSASGAAASEREFPRFAQLDELSLTVAARGGAFAGTTLDLGTRVLLQALADPTHGFGIGMRGESGRRAADSPNASDVRVAVDLGCGTGLLASVLARSFPEAKVIATDASWWACASTAATAKANGFAEQIQIVRGNAGEGIADSSVDLILCNPPFHTGRKVDPGLANELFRGAARMLRPGGQLVTVFNSHLKHRQHLERIVGPTRQLNRTEKFTVTLSTKR